ncbi:hypothetical protein OWI77_09580 [Staphylococcus nepalensis]|uniref:hypothetical protein n=1 Tax=Staphylococcus nepalensis TaxID=214473 RepID=UPI00226DF3FE|nr:hypothetical protein [Staphylococcus nepalensis]MCY1039079.1 hypothetical protein [Staphylococcus nepalensis]
MYKYLYVSLICGMLAGASIFLKLPIFPSLFLPVMIGIIGIIAALITIPNKEINGLLKFGGVLINFMPIMGALTLAQ